MTGQQATRFDLNCQALTIYSLRWVQAAASMCSVAMPMPCANCSCGTAGGFADKLLTWGAKLFLAWLCTGSPENSIIMTTDGMVMTSNNPLITVCVQQIHDDQLVLPA